MTTTKQKGECNREYRLLPFDQREIEWLAAFCRVVTYLQELEDAEQCTEAK